MTFADHNLLDLIENLPEALFLEDMEGTLLDVNQEACRTLGYEKEELVGRNVDVLIPSEESLYLPDQTDQPGVWNKPIETKNLCKDGTELPVELKGSIVQCNGKRRILITIRDISQRKSADAKLKRTQKRLKRALSIGNVAWWEMELPSGKVHFSDRKAVMLGYPPERFETYEDFTELLHPEDYDRAMEAMEKHLSGDANRYEVEYRIRRSDGSYKWLRDVGSITTDNGPTTVTGVVIDIDKRKRTEIRLERSEQRFRTLVENQGEGVVVVDESLKIVFANPAAKETLGVDKGDLIGAHVPDYLSSEQEKSLMEEVEKRKLGEKSTYELEITRPDGEKRLLEVTVTPRNNSKEEYSGSFAVFSDITERKELERSRERQRQQLKELHDTVDRFQATTTEEQLYQVSQKATKNILGFDFSTIYLVEDQTLVPVELSCSDGDCSRSTHPIHEGLARKTYCTGRTLWGDDLSEAEEAEPVRTGLRSYMSVPIGDIAVFQAASTTKGTFSKRDVELAEILAGHLHEEIKRIRLENELKEQAIRDPLTGLYNRRYLNERLTKETQKGERYDFPIAFLMIDVNRFKEINDRYSHQTGDKILQEVAKLLKNNVRSADTVFRYGGDEFLVLMPNTDGEAEVTVSRLTDKVREWNESSEMIDFPLTLAIGVSHWSTRQGREVEEVLKLADKRMYEDKRR